MCARWAAIPGQREEHHYGQHGDTPACRRQRDGQLGEMDDLPHADLVGKCIKVMRGSQAAMNAKTAGLMCLYIQNSENATETREWFRSEFQRAFEHLLPRRLAAKCRQSASGSEAAARCAAAWALGTRLRPPESRS